MPYYTYSSDGWSVTGTYATRAEAYVASCRAGSKEVTFIPSDDETEEWQRRERARFRHGRYIAVPWLERCDLKDIHFAHMSTESSGMIAYTVDVEHGIQDRQTRTKPGRYLQQFYADIFTTTQIADYVAECSAVTQGLQIARTEEDITAVYTGGPSSCMDGQHFNNDMSVDQHPCIVYAQPSDLAVAYVGSKDAASQRCVIWPDKKRYSRIYGTGPLETLLKQDGYSSGNVRDAKIRCICLGHNKYLMPYIDGVDSASVLDDRFIVLDDDGPLSTSDICGCVYCTPQAKCERCDTRYDPDDDDCSGDYCATCSEERWTCYGCHDRFFDQSHYYNEEHYCGDCYTNLQAECACGDCTHRWIEDEEFTDSETATRKRHDLADVCRACWTIAHYCEPCEAPYWPDDTTELTCPTCNRYPRCDQTLDLFDPSLQTMECASHVATT